MKILVTGSQGYIGTAVTKRLGELGHVTISLDSVLGHDLNSPDSDPLFYEETDVVVHLAALAGVEGSDKELDDYFQNNTVATFRLLELIRKFKVPKLVFASSCSVYGNNSDCKETDELKPKSFYGLSKVLCENLIEHYGREYGLSYANLRIFNAIGPGPETPFQKARLLPNLVNKIRSNHFIDIFDGEDGEQQKRDFIDVEDVAESICKFTIGTAANGAYNVGTGRGRTVLEVADKVGQTLRKLYSFQKKKGREGDCNINIANTDKNVWGLKFPIEETISKIL